MRSVRRFLGGLSYAIGPTLIVVGLFIANWYFQPSFVENANWSAEVALATPFILTGLAQTLPILSGNGGLDLSVGPVAGFASVLAAGILVPDGYSSPFVLIPLVLGAGLGAGLVNGALVAYVRLPPIIATLGSYLFYTGITSQALPVPGGEAPGWLINLTASYGPIPALVVVFAAVAVVWLTLSRLAYVRNLLAVGGDERAAYTAGVDTAAVKLIAYGLGGTLAALAGLVLAGVLQSADATVGPPFTISSIAAVALGGIALGGGRGGLLGAGLGGLSYYLIQNLLTVAGVSVYQLNIADGVILIGALALSAQIEILRRRLGARPQRYAERTTQQVVTTEV
jgi:ribose transport system permease protein